MHGHFGKYRPLCQYLEQLPADQQTARLTFHEIEVLVDASLPPSATLWSFWNGGPVAATNWRRSGWQARLDRPLAVRFTRLPRDTP